MTWGPLKNSEICAIHAALVPTANGDGEIIYFGGDEHSPPALLAGQIDKSRRMNCRTEAVHYVASPTADLFCCGHAHLADGRLLIGGGTVTFEAQSPGEHGLLGHFTAERRCWAYNPFTQAFSEIARFGPEPHHEDDDTGGGRWYPTILTLANGQLLAAGGHPSGDDTRHSNDTPERYLAITNTWKRMPELAGVGGYARMHVLPDGMVLVVNAGGNTIRYDAWTGAVSPVTAYPGGLYDGIASSSVLLPLLPEEGYRARVLVTGDVRARRIDLGGAAPAWADTGARTGSAAGKQRRNGAAVILPTGKVLALGGAEDGGNDATGVLTPELYDPATDTWLTFEQPAHQTRNYHSSAILLPDGRVWTSGSNVNSGRTEGGVDRRVLNFEIFNPDYPAGTRPILSDSPANVAYGQSFTVHSPQAESIGRAALIRCGSMTHAFDGDQRYVGLIIESREGNALRLTAPPHGAIAPPGYYLLFLIDNAGRPCAYARFVRVGGEMYVITDRSNFSETEVATLGSPASFYDAFYVVMDGFLGSDAGLPAGPSVALQWADGGGAVPGMSARLENTLFESGSPASGLGQKIVLTYSVRFANNAAFQSPPLDASGKREVSAVVRVGSHEARGSFTLFRRKNPFMLDGNPHWLSLDVRVMQISEDGRFLGVTQGGSAAAPYDFINEALAELRSRPEGGSHPFESGVLPREQERSPVELATSVNGKRVYNYAFARVRYRAPIGQNAENLRVFFRLFTTAAASVEFRPGTYPTHIAGSAIRPLIGLAGGEVASLPFFAAPRIADLRDQDDPHNVRTVNGTGNEETEYFGCWLDINQTEGRFLERPTADGTGGTGPMLSLQQHIRGQHQCLVAEVRYSDDPTPWGATPGDNDNLSQRNLMVVESDNPGGGAGHRVQHTFELKPSEAWPVGTAQLLGISAALPKAAKPVEEEPKKKPGAPAAETHAVVHANVPGHDHAQAFNPAVGAAEKPIAPDQLLIRWRDLPRGSIATLYWPDIDVGELLEVASRRPGGAGMLRQVDAHTLECRIGDVTLIPIPGNRSTRIPGLLSVQLPEDVKAGQVFRISLHQISGRTLKVAGAFQLTIPVSRGPLLRAAEERKLSVLKYIGTAIPPDNRWAPVWKRYLEEISARLRAFGGNPDAILPSPYGTDGRSEDMPGDGKCYDDSRPENGHTGLVREIVYDCFGAFQGFSLELCGGAPRFFRSHVKAVEEIVLRACREHALLTVSGHPDSSPNRIVWHGSRGPA